MLRKCLPYFPWSPWGRIQKRSFLHCQRWPRYAWRAFLRSKRAKGSSTKFCQWKHGQEFYNNFCKGLIGKWYSQSYYWYIIGIILLLLLLLLVLWYNGTAIILVMSFFSARIWTVRFLNFHLSQRVFWRHHDIQHNDIQHNNIQHNGVNCDNQH